VYQFEDNRIRRGIKVTRKRTTIKSLNEDTAAAKPAEKKAEAKAFDDDDDDEDDAVVIDEDDVDDGIRLDGAELTDFLQLSCLIHAHLLLLRRNIAELSPEMGCHMVSSIMYLTTHFDWQKKTLLKPERIYEIINKHRRNFITITDSLTQQGLNDFCEKIIKVATSISPLNVEAMISYLKSELGWSGSQLNQDLPTDHPLYNTVKTLSQFDKNFKHSLSSSPLPLNYESYTPETASEYESHTVRHFGYCPGSRGRYSSLADPVTLTPAEYVEYFSQEPCDLYDKNLDCELNLQSFSISIKN
jgi:hypothetical protein